MYKSYIFDKKINDMKTEFKGTKGEWRYDLKEESIIDENSYSILPSGNVNLEYLELNLKLISCAPEMLQMLVLLIDRLEENELGDLHAVKRSKELIRKATTI